MLPISRIVFLEHILDLITMQLPWCFAMVDQEPEFKAWI
jgi:hypothetical protein